MICCKIRIFPKLCVYQKLNYANRRISTTRINQCINLVKKKTLQTKYQCDNGKPIWLKGGIYDRILYSTTIFLCCIGLIMDVALIYDHAKPQSWKNPVC